MDKQFFFPLSFTCLKFLPPYLEQCIGPSICWENQSVQLESHDVEMPALDWGGHSKKSHNTSLKSNRFIWNHELSERCTFIR